MVFLACGCGTQKQKSREQKVLTQFWVSRVKDEFDLINSIRIKAGISYANAMMERIDGKNWVLERWKE